MVVAGGFKMLFVPSATAFHHMADVVKGMGGEHYEFLEEVRYKSPNGDTRTKKVRCNWFVFTHEGKVYSFVAVATYHLCMSGRFTGLVNSNIALKTMAFAQLAGRALDDEQVTKLFETLKCAGMSTAEQEAIFMSTFFEKCTESEKTFLRGKRATEQTEEDGENLPCDYWMGLLRLLYSHRGGTSVCACARLDVVVIDLHLFIMHLRCRHQLQHGVAEAEGSGRC